MKVLASICVRALKPKEVFLGVVFQPWRLVHNSETQWKINMYLFKDIKNYKNDNVGTREMMQEGRVIVLQVFMSKF